jgi:hypothetical protein
MTTNEVMVVIVVLVMLVIIKVVIVVFSVGACHGLHDGAAEPHTAGSLAARGESTLSSSSQ